MIAGVFSLDSSGRNRGAKQLRKAPTGLDSCLNVTQGQDFDIDSANPHLWRDGAIFKAFEPANWYTAKGAALKKREIEAKGFPEIGNWRFVTMTLNRELFNSPWEAYEFVNERMRYFWQKLRRVYGPFKYCWKLEFHEDGWPHWHALAEILCKVDLDFWREAWGLGRIEVQRAKPYHQEYLFKYIAKSGELPEWVRTYQRQIRFWQTSRGFYTGQKKEQKQCTAKTGIIKKTQQKFNTIEEKLSNWSKSALVVCGKSVSKVSLSLTWTKLFSTLVSLRYSDFTQEISFLDGSSFSVSGTGLSSLVHFLMPSNGTEGQHNNNVKYLIT